MHTKNRSENIDICQGCFAMVHLCVWFCRCNMAITRISLSAGLIRLLNFRLRSSVIKCGISLSAVLHSPRTSIHRTCTCMLHAPCTMLCCICVQCHGACNGVFLCNGTVHPCVSIHCPVHLHTSGTQSVHPFIVHTHACFMLHAPCSMPHAPCNGVFVSNVMVHLCVSIHRPAHLHTQ